MIKYGVIDLSANKIVADDIWSKTDAIEKAKALRKESKNKTDFAVIQSAQVYTTQSETKELAFF